MLGAIADGINAVVGFCQELFSMPAFPRPVPEIGWLGVRRARGVGHLRGRRVRSTMLVAASLLLFGFLGFWEDSMDLLIITLVAVVLVHR